MLFNSYIFILAFLPLTLVVFFRLGSVYPCASTPPIWTRHAAVRQQQHLYRDAHKTDVEEIENWFGNSKLGLMQSHKIVSMCRRKCLQPLSRKHRMLQTRSAGS